MKTNISPDFLRINPQLALDSTLVKTDSLNSQADSITEKDSTYIAVDSLVTVDTIQHVIEKPVPKFGGEEISRFQNIGLGNDWFVGVILFSLFLLASTKFLFSKYLSKLIESIFNSHTANNLFLEKNINMVKGSVLVNLLFVVNISLFAINVMNHFSVSIDNENGFQEFLLVFVAVLCLYIGKVIVVRSLGYIFNGNNESKEYLFTTFLYNKNLGLFLFPVIIALPFIQPHAVIWLINIGLFMLLFFYILRIARGLKILFRKHVSIFYMILYLCALEIFPLLMIYKLLVG
ncbi:DUF4271 domain-containing protein [Ancylomarina sp. DW003]|nr:DUF4271 domain-containing protein [Ancylomarina sp. DW003]MDE5423513.1 DUF4271 domain-containing protein [Ancylomarina sp. DW003]